MDPSTAAPRNVHVLCGDLPGAVKVSQSMVDNQLPLGVVELFGSANDATVIVLRVSLPSGKLT